MLHGQINETKQSQQIREARKALFKAIQTEVLLKETLVTTQETDEDYSRIASGALDAPTPEYTKAIQALHVLTHRSQGKQAQYLPAGTDGNPSGEMDMFLIDSSTIDPSNDPSKQGDTFETWAAAGLAYYRYQDQKLRAQLERVENTTPSNQEQFDTLSEALAANTQKAKDFLAGIISFTEREKRSGASIEAQQLAAKDYFDATMDRDDPKGEWKKKDIGNLSDKPCILVTKSPSLSGEGEGADFSIEIPLTALTDKQKKEMGAIQAYFDAYQTNKPANELVNLRQACPDWFTAQGEKADIKTGKPSADQYDIMCHAQDILDGHALPTQMVSKIPYARNFAQWENYTTEYGQLQKVSQGLRAGTVGNDIKGKIQTTDGSDYRTTATIDTLDQIQHNIGRSLETKTFIEQLFATGGETGTISSITTGAGRRNFFMENIQGKPNEETLNNRNGQAAESWNASEQAATSGKIVYANQGINSSSTSGDQHQFEIMTAEVEETLRSVFKLHQNNDQIKKTVVLLTWALQEYQELAAYLNEGKLTGYEGTDKENHFYTRLNASLVEMGSYLELLEEQLKESQPNEATAEKIRSVIILCKSGKDRTRTVIIQAQAQTRAKMSVLEKRLKSDEKKDFFNFIFVGTSLSNPADRLMLKAILNTPIEVLRYHEKIRQGIHHKIRNGEGVDVAWTQSIGSLGIVDREAISPPWFFSKGNDVVYSATKPNNPGKNTIYVYKKDNVWTYQCNGQTGKISDSTSTNILDQNLQNQAEQPISDEDTKLAVYAALVKDRRTYTHEDSSLKKLWHKRADQVQTNNSSRKSANESFPFRTALKQDAVAAVSNNSWYRSWWRMAKEALAGLSTMMRSAIDSLRGKTEKPQQTYTAVPTSQTPSIASSVDDDHSQEAGIRPSSVSSTIRDSIRESMNASPTSVVSSDVLILAEMPPGQKENLDREDVHSNNESERETLVVSPLDSTFQKLYLPKTTYVPAISDPEQASPHNSQMS